MSRPTGAWRKPLRPLAAACAGTALAAALAASPALAAPQSPSGRAYEQVSPVDKRSNNVSNATVQAAASGDAVAFSAPGAFPGAGGNLCRRAARAQRSMLGFTAQSGRRLAREQRLTIAGCGRPARRTRR